jgi:hypothetical protein
MSEEAVVVKKFSRSVDSMEFISGAFINLVILARDKSCTAGGLKMRESVLTGVQG